MEPKVTAERVTELVNLKSPNFVSVYSNNVAYALNFFDLSMIFGEMQSVDNGKGIVEQTVRIVMSLPHAKIFGTLLLSQIQQYEEKFGVIALPPLDNLPPELQQILRNSGVEMPH